MLIMYRVNNFMSFQNDAILDLRKTSFREHQGHILKVSDFDLLKTVAIYGANASGKSNFISSIAVFQTIVTSQLFLEENTENDTKTNKFRMKPFTFVEDINDTVEFEIIFFNNRLFQYGVSIEKENIKTEWLMVDNELVFERLETGINYGPKYEKCLEKYSKYRKDRLYIALLDYFTLEEGIKEILEDYKDFFMNKLNLYLEIILESSIKGAVGGMVFTRRLEEDLFFRKKVVEYLKEIDVGIHDIIVDTEIRKSRKTDEEEERKVIKTIHGVYDSKGNLKSTKTLELKYESSGTLRFFSYIQQIIQIMEDGGVFIVDELSSRLHPILTKFIVDLFQSDFNTSTQLIFATHDTNLMNRNQFRRDEIVFVDKDNKGVSRIYTLSDLDVRKDASFEKDYFSGKYGAIPIIKSHKILGEGETDG